MIRRIALCALLGMTPAAFAQTASATKVAAPEVKAPRISEFDLVGPRGRTYRISIARPDAPAPAQGYPVIYVVDGNALFRIVADSARFQAFRPSWTGIGPALVVGIGYPNDQMFDMPGRYFDLTTPLPGGGVSPAGGPPMKSGGADAFLDFIEDRVKPEVQRRVAVDRGRQTLFGHSLGGLFALHTLFVRPAAFQSYVAVSPSVWWGGNQTFAEAEHFATSGKANGDHVLLTVGSNEQAMSKAAQAASGAAEQKAALDHLQIVDGVRRMARVIEKAPGLTVRERVFEGEDHGSTVGPAASLAIRFALLPDDQFEPCSDCGKVEMEH